MSDIIHKARYFHPGSFVSEESTTRLTARDPQEALDRAPGSAFAFQLFDIPDPAAAQAAAGDGFEVIPKPFNESGRYYINGLLKTINQLEIENRDGELDILIANAKCNNWPVLVLCRTGNWQPFEEGDEVLFVRPDVSAGRP